MKDPKQRVLVYMMVIGAMLYTGGDFEWAKPIIFTIAWIAGLIFIVYDPEE